MKTDLMKAFLARTRRLFYAGTISLILTMIISIFTKGMGYFDLWSEGVKVNSFNTIFCLFLAVTPIVYIFLVVISSAYIRKRGQSAAFQQTKPFISTFFSCVGSDFISPFKCIASFFTALVGKYPDSYTKDLIGRSKFASIRRFIWMLLILCFCIYGMSQINDFAGLIQHFNN